MQARSFGDRVRHAILFEIIGLAISTPGTAILFDQPVTHMGVIGIISATTATLWNFVYNIGFDYAMLKLTGRAAKSLVARIVHALLFEGGLIIALIPLIAWYLGISIWDALIMDIAIVTFYLVYAFLFNIAYDRIFPLKEQANWASVESVGKNV